MDMSSVWAVVREKWWGSSRVVSVWTTRAAAEEEMIRLTMLGGAIWARFVVTNLPLDKVAK